MQDKKKKLSGKKKNQSSSPGSQIFKAKAVVPTKAQRGFTTKRPPKVHLSYPL